MENPIYLGDAVYATYDDYHVILTAGDHDPIKAQHVVYLDKDVMAGLIKWYQEIEAGK